ncbi:hypothetical protein HK097_009656 [Rhizophlyctis rosea]|uniref:Glycosyltransferase 2-like domain-containing protein n=1 Tax=Rhizophlyctis rosea TaxID=64517 RepID=A0AAD5X7L7_9FUNG|nr:hypothetical protein HK097_009656 [Rhizophlyctis rosea]
MSGRARSTSPRKRATGATATPPMQQIRPTSSPIESTIPELSPTKRRGRPPSAAKNRPSSTTSSQDTRGDASSSIYDSDAPINGRSAGPSRTYRDSYQEDYAPHTNIEIEHDGPSRARSRSPKKRSPTTTGAPGRSYALDEVAPISERTNKGNTRLVTMMLAEAWIVHMAVILGGTYVMTFHVPQFYIDDEVWNYGCYWKLGWLLPLPYTIICFLGLIMPYRTPKFLHRKQYASEGDRTLKQRRCDNLYILTVTKGDNKEAVMRAWKAHRHLESIDPCIRVHVLTDEPNHFEGINCFTCPKSFTTQHSKYKARALEWYRQTMRFTENDWVLHLDEESVIDDLSVQRCLEFIRFETSYHFGQGVILYNQYRFWRNPFFTVADGLRVGDDLSRFHLQYTYMHRPFFGAHGSFLLTNGRVENDVTWDLGSLTEDYQFATKAQQAGYKCGSIPGLVREQSPLDIMGFLKQRRRWYVGIRRLPQFLPKLWNFFWTLGILCLYGTIASVILGVYIPLGTPRWFGLLKDFSFMTFVYLYVLGMTVQNVDKGYNVLLVLVGVPVTILLQFVAVILEALAVMYALVFPPKDFDVIKK